MSDVAIKDEGNLPIPLSEMGEDAGAGGKVNLRDMSVPYLAILQGMSPQVQPASGKFIKGAGVSMLYMTVTDELFAGDTGLTIVPCYYERVVNEWTPKNKGGGLVATHDPEGDILSRGRVADPNKPAELFLPNGNQVIETMNNYILAKLSERGWIQCIFPLKSTALKYGRKWNSNIATLKIPNSAKQAPRWLYEWQLTTGPEQKGDKVWYSPVFRQGGIVSREAYEMAREFSKIAATGMLRRPMEEERLSEEDSPI